MVGTDSSVKGLNVFNYADQTLLRTLQHGEFNIHGWRPAALVARLNLTPLPSHASSEGCAHLASSRKSRIPTAITSFDSDGQPLPLPARSRGSTSFWLWLLYIQVFA
jgi:hypothetical protein